MRPKKWHRDILWDEFNASFWGEEVGPKVKTALLENLDGVLDDKVDYYIVRQLEEDVENGFYNGKSNE